MGAVEDKAFHGGQDWMTTENLIADFSVTTGIMGPCEEALSFLDGNLHKIHHYPALDQEPYRSELSHQVGQEGVQQTHPHSTGCPQTRVFPGPLLRIQTGAQTSITIESSWPSFGNILRLMLQN